MNIIIHDQLIYLFILQKKSQSSMIMVVSSQKMFKKKRVIDLY